ncbi:MULTISPECIES: acyl-CoA dehydrogenase family protein [Microbulbifer]|uniref:Acyl-CoA dehydrogenase family protein n=1 Tax=Microbulbifer variabilis TaxID=266805 RepID=A0ABY4VGD0_9GAMM|nr:MULTISPECIES: acyl-CoA dehydrogenase family protein [Microbulbifer]USD23338.1 acyl-CoA dehydrogenase family protein [Microbulbifer variabilis]WHI49502.1 acyl-CoA dehydrogenase family protein [Microbulbifer sp. MLAF003]
MYDIDASRMASPFYDEGHQEWRTQLRRFVDREITPYITQWDEDGQLPAELWKKAAEVGLLQMSYPENYGGIETDVFHMIVAAEELARPGAGGLYASLMVHGIALPPLLHYGSEALKDQVIPSVLRGDKHISLAITEPGAGSDVANLQCRAERDGDDYIVTGEKTYITGGMRANWFTAAVRTGEEGFGGISLLLIPADTKGVSRQLLDKKQGWWCSDTASIFFDQVRVPASNLIGGENQGFLPIVHNFNRERLGIAASCVEFSRVCLQDAIEWAQERQTFGKRLANHQVIRHKFAQMLQRINATQAYLDLCAWAEQQHQLKVADIALLKVQATETLEFCAREAMQVLGGAGYMRGSRIERIYREVRVNAIGGGSEEIMRDLASRQMGI